MNLGKKAAIAILVLLGVSPLNASASPTYGEIEAKTVLMRYFDALAQGDVLALRSLMGGDLLEKRSRLLGNPTYPVSLIETYGNASFSVDAIRTVGQMDMILDASISFDQDGRAQRQYLLRKEEPGGAYRIHSEALPGDL